VPGGALLRQTAYYQLRGLAGLIYWYGLYPIHRIIFRGMIAAIARAPSGQHLEEHSECERHWRSLL